MKPSESLSFFMFVYDEPIEMVKKCVGAFVQSLTKPIMPSLSIINNHPGWVPPHDLYQSIFYPKLRFKNNVLNQSQARNWNQATRLTLLDEKEWCGIIAPDTIAKPGWLEAADEDAEKGLHLIGHLNFSVFRADTIRKLGWFDERMVSGGSEDLDMYLRFEEAGIPFSRESFSGRNLEKRGGGNQYRDTNEKVAQFRVDCEYWLKKWRKDKNKMPSSDQIYFHPENRQRNWPEIDFYPPVLDRDAYR
jgi:hypothetical protein